VIASAAVGVPSCQSDVIEFLSDPGNSPGKPPHVDRIDTHGACVFLAGNEVYKIKRAVKYSYMDFSTLERRRAACAREIEINRPHAPGIYRGLVAITRDDRGHMAFGGPGQPVEWAVHMARFAEADVLANRAAEGPFPDPLSKALADSVARYHAIATVATTVAFADEVQAIVADVSGTLASLLPETDRAAVGDLTARLATASHTCAPLLERRSRAGHVRRCHGDLHLGNIVLIEGVPVPFDAIEFDERMATIDTLYDLAFLLMDLDHRGQRPAANRVLNRYVWRRQEQSDLEALAALPLFLALRAAIRAMVAAQKAGMATSPDLQPTHDYLCRALGYLDDTPPALLLVGGLSGSGKSTLAAQIAPRIGRAPGALHLRTDLERKALFHVEEFDRLPPEAYTREATAAVYDRVLHKVETALRAGHSVIADAVHADPSERSRIASLARSTGARLAAFWLEAPKDVLMARVRARTQDASDATPQVIEQQINYDIGVLEWTRLDASGPPEETLGKAMTHLHASILAK
jgi:aminoglycoside phosphotransferase family enzyme/predicted kinase